MKLTKYQRLKAAKMKREGIPLKTIAAELDTNVTEVCRATKNVSVKPKNKRCALQRPPAVYSNKSREQFIEEILALDI